MIKLSHDQETAIKNLVHWFGHKNARPFVTLGGYAGTGKTTLISLYRKELHTKDKKTRVAFCSYTGKATRVLLTKLKESNSIYKQDNVSTIHSLIYSPVVNNSKEIVGWERKDEIKFDLIIVDEASMVDQNIWSDLLSYKIPIVAVGDHGQLPPIQGNFNLMKEPMLKLEEIHRQAKENPIIQLSIHARKEGIIQPENYSSTVRKITRDNFEAQEIVNELMQNFDEDTLILCGYNNTRIKLNQSIRGYKDIYLPEPQPEDRVICLRNNHEKGIYNGMTGTINTIDDVEEDWYFAKISMDGEDVEFNGLVSKKQFNNPQTLNFTEHRREIMKGDLFDFGYALTVHKAQGSQAKRVLLFEERFKQMDDDMWKRWLYTAVTRAEEELYIIGD